MTIKMYHHTSLVLSSPLLVRVSKDGCMHTYLNNTTRKKERDKTDQIGIHILQYSSHLIHLINDYPNYKWIMTMTMTIIISKFMISSHLIATILGESSIPITFLPFRFPWSAKPTKSDRRHDMSR